MKNDLEMFELTSPSGQKYSFPKYDYGVVYFHLESQSNEAGVWTYYFKFNPVVLAAGPGFRATLEVLGTVMDSSFDDVVALDFWTETKTNVVVLYAKLTSHQGQLPVNKARIHAKIYGPENERYSLDLHDSGTGYPDITQGDGIYSAYFTGISSATGFYSVTVEADSDEGRATMTRPLAHGGGVGFACCGSKYPEYMSTPVSRFW